MNDYDLLVGLASHHTQLKQVSGKLLGLCPIHDEKTPSFWVKPNGKFECYGCGSHGDAIDLYQAINKTDFETAKRALGLWDENGKPNGPKQKRWPTCYKTADKKKAYRAAVASIQAGKDMKISFNGAEYLNYQFIAFCLSGVENYRHYLSLISMGITGEIRKAVFLNNVIDEVLKNE